MKRIKKIKQKRGVEWDEETQTRTEEWKRRNIYVFFFYFSGGHGY